MAEIAEDNPSTPGVTAPASAARRRRRWPRVLGGLVLGLAATFVALWCGAYWYQNTSRMSDAEFAAALDRALAAGVRWLEQNRTLAFEKNTNVSMYHLLQRMDRLHPTPVIAAGVQKYMAAEVRPAYLKRLLDDRAPASAFEINAVLPSLLVDYRWLAYAIEPQRANLAETDRASLFDPQRHHGLVLVHQLWALYHLKRLHADPRVTDELLVQIGRRIADEHAREVLVSQPHAERVAFLLLAGRPDLVKRRWLERLIEHQNDNGGWHDRWYAFGIVPLPLEDEATDEHITIIALSALYEARYACPEHYGLPRATGQ